MGPPFGATPWSHRHPPSPPETLQPTSRPSYYNMISASRLRMSARSDRRMTPFRMSCGLLRAFSSCPHRSMQSNSRNAQHGCSRWHPFKERTLTIYPGHMLDVGLSLLNQSDVLTTVLRSTVELVLLQRLLVTHLRRYGGRVPRAWPDCPQAPRWMCADRCIAGRSWIGSPFFTRIQVRPSPRAPSLTRASTRTPSSQLFVERAIPN